MFSSIYFKVNSIHVSIMGPPGVRMAIFFRELGSTCNYLRGAREQAHNFGDLGSLAKKEKN